MSEVFGVTPWVDGAVSTGPLSELEQDRLDVAARKGSLVAAMDNPITGGNDFSGDVSTLKLPAGVTDLTGGASGGSGGYYTARDNSQHAVTTTGSEETLLTITIPAENLSADSVIVISPLWSCTNSANSKAFKITLNGQIVSSVSQTTVASFHSAHIVALRSLSSQVANNSATSSPYGVTISTGVTTLSADLSSGAELAFIASRTNGSDSAALERVLVEVI